ncbi:MAG: sulfatase-like hydrolase/transferase [Armatimonadia bacterium]|nr:sulfatase-like hydrolase/transferase [Armatimonadia bacterium]
MGAGAIGLSAAAWGQPPTERRPNIVVIMCDDMGYSDIGCYGGEIPTPNIDRLARGGMRFTQFYNAARCCPTRAALLTGTYPHMAGMGGMVHGDDSRSGPYQGYLAPDTVTLAEALRPAGYRAYMSGKWHVGEHKPHWPLNRGFERYFGLVNGGANYWNIEKTKAPGVKRQLVRRDEVWQQPTDGSFYMTDAFSDHAVEVIDGHGESSEPFLHYVAYTAPHWPLHAWPEDIERNRGRYRKGWDTLRNERYERMVEMGIIDPAWDLSPRDHRALPWRDVEDKDLMELKMAVYAAQIECMDRGIGRILDALERNGQADNTLVLFLSDNGACHESGPLGFDRRNNGVPCGREDSYMSYGLSWANASNTPFRQFKHWIHEGGISTPLIAHWPGHIEPGSWTSQTGHVIDIMATCLDLAEAEYPQEHGGRAVRPLQGRSLVPVVEGGAREPHEFLAWEHYGNRGIRNGRWKLVADSEGAWELYDLEADRTELHDLSKDRPEKAQDLEDRYHAWCERVGV